LHRRKPELRKTILQTEGKGESPAVEGEGQCPNPNAREATRKRGGRTHFAWMEKEDVKPTENRYTKNLWLNTYASGKRGKDLECENVREKVTHCSWERGPVDKLLQRGLGPEKSRNW